MRLKIYNKNLKFIYYMDACADYSFRLVSFHGIPFRFSYEMVNFD